jgi:hypothetical protein
MAINPGDVGIKTNDRCRNWSSKIRVLNIPGICGMLVDSLNAPFFFGAQKGTRFGEKEHKMAQEQKSFEDLVKEAPAAPAAGTVSLVGTLAQASEAGKFVLTLQDGSAVTLETAAVKGHTVLGTSVGQTIVRIDVKSDKIRNNPQPLPWYRSDPEPAPWYRPVPKHPILDKYPWEEPVHPGPKHPYGDPDFGSSQLGGVAPFALATPHQAPAGTLVQPLPWHTIWRDNTAWWQDKLPITDITGRFPYPD